ncbi:MAG: DUF3502 domain-containing protein [Christensenellales bacterium]|jgi:putative aldouronate transport system substrate-binding protein
MKKILATLLTAALIFTMVAAATAAEKPTSYNGNNVSEKVALKYLMVGTKQPDHELVWQAISDYIETKINATITCTVIDLADYATRLPLVLASGEPYDLVVTAQGWLFYDTQAPAGGYKEITLDMIHQYMPLTTEHQTDIETHLDQNRLADGKVFMVPASFINLTGNALAISIREDIRKANNVPAVTDLASLEVYFDSIKANNPEMYPYAASANNNELKGLLYTTANNKIQLTGSVLEDFFNFQYAPGMTAEEAAAALTFVGDDPLFTDYAKLMKSWAEKGYWSRSAIADTTPIRDSYENSQSAAFVQNTGTMGVANNAIRAKGLEPLMIDLFPTAIRYMGATTTGVAIPHSSENPKRALMFLDLLKYDPVVYELYRWGVEGKHWEWVDEASRIWKDGPDQSQYVFGQGSWGFSSPEFEPRYKVDSDPESVVMFNSWWADGIKVANPLAGLNIDLSTVQNEISALTNVRAEYLYLLDLGLVSDVDATIAAMNAAAKTAGLDAVMAEIQRQIAEWISNKQ